MRLCTFRRCGPEKPNAAKPLRFFARVANFDSVKPIINLEETIGKTVGRRGAPADSLKYALGLQKMFGHTTWRSPIRRGVYRFHTHEEADAWMMNYLVRRKAI